MTPKRTLVGFTVDKYEGLMPSVILSGLKMVGVQYVELTKTAFAEVEAISKKMRGLRAGFHLPLIHDDGWDLSCPDFKEQIDEVIGNVNRYKDDLRIQHVIAHPPEPEASDHAINSSLEFLLENLSRLQVPVYLENVPSGTPEDLKGIFTKAKQKLGNQLAGVCFDAPHFFVTGYDPVTQFRQLDGQIGCVHLSDCFRNDDVHLPFNKGGELPIDTLLSVMKERNFRGYVTLEIKPESLRDIHAYIESYLKVLASLSFTKYIRAKARWFLIRPLVSHFIS